MGDVPVEALKAHLDRDALLDAARALIRIDTTNPPGNEAPAARWVRERMLELGFRDVQLVEPHPGRASVVGEWGTPGWGATRSLLWNGHLDVVPAGDASAWRYPPFAGVVDGGRLWGRGSADMKGAVAAILEAVAILRRAGLRPAGRLVVQAVADEEMLGPFGTQYLVERFPVRADAAICGEPTGLRPFVAARGLLWVEITTTGRSCHASTPHLGVNAVVKMAAVIQSLHGLRFTARHPLLGSPTLSVGTIAGGSKTNVVPDRCTITLDRRLVPGESPESALAAIEQELRALEASDPDCQARVRVLHHAQPSEVGPDEPIVQAVARVRALLGLQPAPPAGMPGTTDARFLVNQAGIPTVILGPGQLDQAHTVDESVAVAELEQAALLYAGILCDWLGCA
ncbi:M20 family metallopeptidase [Carboxydochorda subterranea]|uniref:M20 family metallopeptidase n=1 Tax=Carboxydichorda subterranea TaxID=3109565 RepID=A0ABZ1BV13_9FIRM|nr:M20 family metallopeptidase [Limnochorda sp. L945t]WRP16629.1 M20 family metallopeptidase [Limnochorda sp. L945t]